MISVDVCHGGEVRRGVPADQIRRNVEDGDHGKGRVPAGGGGGRADGERPAAHEGRSNGAATTTADAPPVGVTGLTGRTVPGPSGLSPSDLPGLRDAPAATLGDGPGATAPPVVWVHVSDPTEEDWRVIAGQFDFHPLALEDARKQDQRPKIDPYDGYLFLSVRAWAGAAIGTTPGSAVPGSAAPAAAGVPVAAVDLNYLTREIDVFLGPNYLVTIERGEEGGEEGGGPIAETRRRWARSPRQVGSQPPYLLYLLLDAVVDDYFPALDQIDEELDRIETDLYSGALNAAEGAAAAAATAAPLTAAPPDMKPALALKKRLLLLRQAVAPLRDVLNQLLRTDDPGLMPPELRAYYMDVYDHTLRIVEQVDLHRDIVGGVMDVMMAQASNRMAETSNRLNQVMKALTGISTILMSAALIAGIYGMNFKNMPELNWAYGYPLALGSMALVAGGLALYFRRIRWF